MPPPKALSDAEFAEYLRKKKENEENVLLEGAAAIGLGAALFPAFAVPAAELALAAHFSAKPPFVKPTPYAVLYAFPQPLGVVPPQLYGLPEELFSVGGFRALVTAEGRAGLAEELRRVELVERAERERRLTIALRYTDVEQLRAFEQKLLAGPAFNSEQLAQRRLTAAELNLRGLQTTIPEPPSVDDYRALVSQSRQGAAPIVNVDLIPKPTGDDPTMNGTPAVSPGGELLEPNDGLPLGRVSALLRLNPPDP